MVKIRIATTAITLAALALVACSDDEPSAERDAATTSSSTSTEPLVMFQRAPGGEVTGENESDVYLVDADGSENDVELLFTGGAAGRWSPDGGEVSVFCCDDGMVAHIVDVDTGDLRVVETPDPTLELFATSVGLQTASASSARATGWTTRAATASTRYALPMARG